MISSIGRRRTFDQLRHDGRRVRHGAVRMTHLPVSELVPTPPGPQLAFAIGRSFGNAVERNRGRRRLRAAFIEVWRSLEPGRERRLRGAFLLTGSRSLLTSPYDRIVADVDRCFDRLSSGSSGSSRSGGDADRPSRGVHR